MHKCPQNGTGMSRKRLRAIDLYSGVGGWGLGLKMAGIKVVASYDQWPTANQTNERNNRHKAHTIDIRKLKVANLPSNIDVVVGSPPCTEFSFSNKGGGGDISDGLRDIRKFLRIVQHLKPRYWAMENVPRVAEILRTELKPGGRLYEFRHLKMHIDVIDMERFGLPQRRKRCIAGNFNFKLLELYAAKKKATSLGDVVEALSASPAKDPLFGLRLSPKSLHDHNADDFLNREEARINRAAKTSHPVYNKMTFPDALDRSVRTITATCTRVSRESIIIRTTTKPRRYRRLSIRERASLQGFPITFQFYGGSLSDKMRMVGNAVPPLFSYYIGHTFRKTPSARVPSLKVAIRRFKKPILSPEPVATARTDATFRKDRRFRFAIPHLRLKSGVRFELKNSFADPKVEWLVGFTFGTSKSIHGLTLDAAALAEASKPLRKALPKHTWTKIETHLDCLRMFGRSLDAQTLQDSWTKQSIGQAHPFALLETLSAAARDIQKILQDKHELLVPAVDNVVRAQYGKRINRIAGQQKLHRNAILIGSGLLIGATANIALRSAN